MVRVRERPFEALGRVRLTPPQHVTHVLGVGVQAQRGDAEVAVQHVAALDHDGARVGEIPAPSLHVHVGVEPGAEAEVVDALAHPPGNVVRRGTSGRDHAVRERRVDHSPHDLHEAPVHGQHRGRADLLILERQPLGAHDAVAVGGRKHAKGLPLEYQEIRAPAMLPVYRRLMEVVWGVIDTAFSNRVITPGRTTTDDVAWWMRQRVNDLGFGTWFHTDVDVQRRGRDLSDSGPVVIQRGDVLHCDFGITALGLNTDTQHMGYVLRRGETDAPEGLKRARANSNHLQDLLLAEMRPGRTGNDVLAAALAQMRAAGINGTIYTHPIGDRGHGAGPLIGLWDHQEGVPERGDVPLVPGSWF